MGSCEHHFAETLEGSKGNLGVPWSMVCKTANTKLLFTAKWNIIAVKGAPFADKDS